MRLLIIYGPPGAGKLTVAREIGRRTGFRVFHNHLSIDAVEPIFEFGTEPFARLVESIRVQTIAEAAKQDVDLIYTFCYAKGHDEPHMELIRRAAAENGGEVLYVLLKCDIEELEHRVIDESRLKFGKVNDPELLDELMEKYDLCTPLPDSATFTVDNTNLSAADAAELIIGHFKLEANSK
jgi:shikimate kinase